MVRLQGIKNILQKIDPVGTLQARLKPLLSSVLNELSLSKNIDKFLSLVYLKIILFKDRVYVEQDSSEKSA